MNTYVSWWYTIEVLWSKTIGLCRKLNIIYNIITCNPQANGDIWLFSMSWFFQTVCFNELVNIFMEAVMHFIYHASQMNRKLKRTAFIWSVVTL